MATVIRSKESQDETKKWSESFWVEMLVRDLHKAGLTVQNEMSKNRTHFTRQINEFSYQNGIVLSRIGALADAALMCEKRIGVSK